MQVTKISQRGNAVGITIPRAYLRELNWGKGDFVWLEIQNGDVLLVRHARYAPAVELRGGPERRDYAETQG